MQAHKSAKRRHRLSTSIARTTMRCCFLAMALALYEEYGFAMKRGHRAIHRALAIMDEIVDRYGDDYLLTALEKRCEDYNLETVGELK